MNKRIGNVFFWKDRKVAELVGEVLEVHKEDSKHYYRNASGFGVNLFAIKESKAKIIKLTHTSSKITVYWIEVPRALSVGQVEEWSGQDAQLKISTYNMSLTDPRIIKKVKGVNPFDKFIHRSQ